LLAIAMPLAVHRVLTGRPLVTRVVGAMLVLGFLASIAASGSRGGLVGALVGTLAVLALVDLRPRRRIALALAAGGVFALCVWTMTLARPLEPVGSVPSPGHIASIHGYADAERVLPLDAEIGSPWWTHRPGYRRTAFSGSLRLVAWRGTIEKALERPVVGYGFGAEQWAFVNRYYAFNSQNPENGYVGLLLQVGFLGLALFLVVLALCVVPTIRLVRRRATEAAAVATVGAAFATGTVAMTESFFHGPGGIAYVAFWVSLLVAAALGLSREER
jgi:O-antigen ligase